MSKEALPINTIITGDCLEVMADWPDQCIQTCVTSPPYWGLRDYGVEGQLGLEKTPEEFVAKMVEVFRGVWRVLRDDGTLWLNLGDSYNGSGGIGGPGKSHTNQGQVDRPDNRAGTPTLKPKDLCGIPWRVALALQADGWYLRQDIVWAKPNPMPESCTDRCTKAHEYIFLLTKKPRYFYDAEAIKEPCSPATHARISQDLANQVGSHRANGGGKTNGPMKAVIAGSTRKMARAGSGIKNNDSFKGACVLQVSNRNKRSVWTVTTKSFSEAHFATFPPKLIEPCILAGTSKKGACPECGAPWERVSEKGESDYARIKRETGQSYQDMRAIAIERGKGHKGNREHIGGTRDANGNCFKYKAAESKTTGWRPTCGCSKTAVPVPCVVFDPFMGAGTTAVVAIQHGRNYVGTELSPEYTKIAEKRIKAVVTGVPQKEAQKGQGALFL